MKVKVTAPEVGTSEVTMREVEVAIHRAAGAVTQRATGARGRPAPCS